MNRVLLIVAALSAVAAVACSGNAAPFSAQSPTPLPASPTPAAAPASSPGVASTPAAVGGSETASTDIAFFLEVSAPGDESVISVPAVEVRGRTVADAVVSVNDQVVGVDADGSFAASVSLEEGPNAVEVIASSFQGEQDARLITVIYVP